MESSRRIMRKLLLTFILSLWCLITFAATRFWVGGTGTWDNSSTAHWSTSTGGATGASNPGIGDAVVFDASSGGGTVTPNYNLSVVSITMGAFTGTLDFSANNNSPTLQTFSGTGTGARTLNMGTGTWTITGNAATVWTLATVTNLTFSAGTSTLQFTYAGSTGTRTISTGGTSLSYNNILVSAGSDIISFPTSTVMPGNFSTSGFTGTFSKGSASLTIGGNLTMGAGSIWTTTGGTITLNSSGSVSINTNGVQVNQSFTVNSTGTFTLAADLDMSGSNAATLLGISAGTFTTNNFNVTSGLFSSNGTGIRTINMGSSTQTLVGIGNVFSISSNTNITYNAGTSTIKCTNSTSSSKTFISTTGLNYYNLWLTGGGTGLFIIGTSTVTTGFNSIKIDAPLTVQVFAGKTITANSITWTGSAGNVNTLQSTSAGTPWILSIPSGNVTQDYISVQDSYATGGAWFYATPHSVNVSGNSGWIFLPVGKAGNFFMAN